MKGTGSSENKTIKNRTFQWVIGMQRHQYIIWMTSLWDHLSICSRCSVAPSFLWRRSFICRSIRREISHSVSGILFTSIASRCRRPTNCTAQSSSKGNWYDLSYDFVFYLLFSIRFRAQKLIALSTKRFSEPLLKWHCTVFDFVFQYTTNNH